MSFAASFTVTSPGGGYTDAHGVHQVAAANTPRFDHDGSGNAKGLLVQGVPEASAPDIVKLDEGIAPNQGCTILHVYQQPGGAVVSRAVWSTRPTRTVDSLLNAKGWHRSLIVVPRALAVVDGYVSFRGVSYPIAGYLAVNASRTEVLGVGDPADHVLTGAG